MAETLKARLVPALQAGNYVSREDIEMIDLPAGYHVLRGADLWDDHPPTLAAPFEAVPVLPDRAAYAGEAIAVVTGSDWTVLDRVTEALPQSTGPAAAATGEAPFSTDHLSRDSAASRPADGVSEQATTSMETTITGSTPGETTPGATTPSETTPGATTPPAERPGEPTTVTTDQPEPGNETSHESDENPDDGSEAAAADAETGAVRTEVTTAQQIAEGRYSTAVQLHMADGPLWATATPAGKGASIRLPTQWPSLVRFSVARSLDVQVRSVSITTEPVAGSRDSALWVSAHVAVVATLVARYRRRTITVAYRADQRHLTGGRSAASVRWTSRLDTDGMLTDNSVWVALDVGAYETLTDETERRLRIAAQSLYRGNTLEYHAELHRSPTVPTGVFEGIGTAQLAFAREVHYNRLAELAQEDPLLWRQRHLRSDWPVLQELLAGLADQSDFHRRYSANELVRKRRLQLPRNTSALKGIGCAVAEQVSGMTGEKELGSLAVELDQGGAATLFCSLPTPTPRLTLAWRQIVAQELGLDVESVSIDTAYVTEQQDSGPRLFSRGVSVVPRTIQSICQAIQKQRFREPLPIRIRRSIRTSRAARTPAHALRSAGAAAVEAVLLPSSMEIDVKSVTMAVYAGRILDRGMAEAELRRGIYQALNWALHEAVPDSSMLGRATLPERYTTSFRGKPPKIKIFFGNPVRRDGPTGVGELPFLTVPAALMSALSQASGLYLDALPARPATLLRMLQEE